MPLISATGNFNAEIIYYVVGAYSYPDFIDMVINCAVLISFSVM